MDLTVGSFSKVIIENHHYRKIPPFIL